MTMNITFRQHLEEMQAYEYTKMAKPRWMKQQSAVDKQRRQFMIKAAKATAVLTLGGTYTLDKLVQGYHRIQEKEIIGNPRQYLHMMVHEIDYELKNDGTRDTTERHGLAVAVESPNKSQYLLTCEHIANMTTYDVRTPFGLMQMPITIHKKQHRLSGSLEYLTEVCCNPDDVAIYTGSQAQLNTVPVNEHTPEPGTEMYIVGNPFLQQHTARRTKVIDTDGHAAFNLAHGIGLQATAMPGDSGGALLDLNGHLRGIMNCVVNGFAYAVPIKDYMDVIRRHEQ